jgi:hypothetical protein
MALFITAASCEGASGQVIRDSLLGLFITVFLDNPTSRTLTFSIFNETGVSVQLWTQGPNSSRTIALTALVLTAPAQYSFRASLA